MTPIELLNHLDHLDALRASATPGEWNSDELDGGSVWIGRTIGNSRLVVTCERGHADAEFIVAAVNVLPQLTAALRAVFDLADELEAESGSAEEYGAGALDDEACYRADGLATAYQRGANRLRDTITAALSPAVVSD